MYEELIEKTKMIYNGINCNKNDCEDCKTKAGHLEWCPKSYADVVADSIKILSRNQVILDQIINSFIKRKF